MCERETMTERQRDAEKETCNTSNQGRVRERETESDNDREATRERETCNTSTQGRVCVGGERVPMTERQQQSETCNTSNQGRVRESLHMILIQFNWF